MYVYVVRTCIQYGTNVYLGGMKMGGMKRRWYEKPGYLIDYIGLLDLENKSIKHLSFLAIKSLW